MTTRLDDGVRDFALKGGPVIVVADSADSIPDLVKSDLAVAPRNAFVCSIFSGELDEVPAYWKFSAVRP